MKNVLLDSNVLLNYFKASKLFGPRAIRLMNQSHLHYSPISLFELKQKEHYRPGFKHPITKDRLQELGFEPLAFDDLSFDGFVELETKDPFDRMLVSQAKGHQMKFLTADMRIIDSGLDFVVDITL